MRIMSNTAVIFNIELREDEAVALRQELSNTDFSDETSPLVYKLWSELGNLT